MEDNKATTLSEAVSNVIQAFFKTIKDLTKLASAEAHLAAKSLVNILILTMVIRALLITTWLFFCGSLAYFIFYTLQNWAITLLIVTALNLVLLIIAVFLVMRQKKNLGFHATRRQLRSQEPNDSLDDGAHHEYFEKENKTSRTESNE